MRQNRQGLETDWEEDHFMTLVSNWETLKADKILRNYQTELDMLKWNWSKIDQKI